MKPITTGSAVQYSTGSSTCTVQECMQGVRCSRQGVSEGVQHITAHHIAESKAQLPCPALPSPRGCRADTRSSRCTPAGTAAPGSPPFAAQHSTAQHSTAHEVRGRKTDGRMDGRTDRCTDTRRYNYIFTASHRHSAVQ